MKKPSKHEQVYEFIAEFITEKGYAPTLQQVADAVGYSSRSSAHTAVWTLISAGRLSGSPGRALRLNV